MAMDRASLAEGIYKAFKDAEEEGKKFKRDENWEEDQIKEETEKFADGITKMISEGIAKYVIEEVCKLSLTFPQEAYAVLPALEEYEIK